MKELELNKVNLENESKNLKAYKRKFTSRY